MKKRFISMILASVFFLLLFCSCAADKEPPHELQLMLPALGRNNELVAQTVTQSNYYGPAEIDPLLNSLMGQLFGTLVELEYWALEDNSLRVVLSRDYFSLSEIDKTLTTCCIVLTLCQLDSVSRVQVSVLGTPIYSQPFLSPEDIIFTGAEEIPREILVELYFPRSGGRGLGFEIRQLTLTEDDDLYTSVTHALLSGPENSSLRSPFPENLTVKAVKMEGGICHVNFSSHLLEIESPPAELDLLLYSIVDTLGNLDSVNSVQLLVEGEPLKSFGNTDTSVPLEPDFGLLGD